MWYILNKNEVNVEFEYTTVAKLIKVGGLNLEEKKILNIKNINSSTIYLPVTNEGSSTGDAIELRAVFGMCCLYP